MLQNTELERHLRCLDLAARLEGGPSLLWHPPARRAPCCLVASASHAFVPLFPLPCLVAS